MAGFTIRKETELEEMREPEGAVYKLAGRGIGTENVSYRLCRIATGSKTSEQVFEEAEELCMLVRGRCDITIGNNYLRVEAPTFIKIPPTVRRTISNPYDREAVWVLLSTIEGSFDYDKYTHKETRGFRLCSDWGLVTARDTSGTWLQRLEYILGLKQIGISYVDLKPSQRVDHHNHETVEEIYFSLDGPSEAHIEDKVFDVPAFTFARCDPPIMRSVLNNPNSKKNVQWCFTGPQRNEFRKDWEYQAATGIFRNRE